MTMAELNHNLCNLMEKYFFACKSNPNYIGEEKHKKYCQLLAELWENWYLGYDCKVTRQKEIPHHNHIALYRSYNLEDILEIFLELGLELISYKKEDGKTFVDFRASSNS